MQTLPISFDPHRAQTRNEEAANTLSAAIGLAGAGLGAVALTIVSKNSAAGWPIQPGLAIYLAALLAVHGISTLYHGLPTGRKKSAARVADHLAIYALIAGTYTPFALGPLRSHGGWILAGVEWALAGVGVIFVLSGGMQLRRLSNALYLAMGWLGLFLPDFRNHVPAVSLAWLLAGGIAYSAGVVFYSAKRMPFSHAIWHLFVIGGSACHFVAVTVLFVSLPR
jgi:hemolysin III